MNQSLSWLPLKPGQSSLMLKQLITQEVDDIEALIPVVPHKLLSFDSIREDEKGLRLNL